MNFEDLLEKAIYRISLRLSDVETEWMSIAGETLSKIYGLSNEQIKNYLYDGGYLGDMSSDINKVKRILQQAHESNLQDMVNLYDDITDTVYQEGTSIAVEKGQHLLPFDVFKSTFNPMLNDVMDHYETMAESTTVNEGYRDTIKHFVNRLTLDDDRINGPTALRKAVRELTEQGISYVDYDNGEHPYTRRLDSSVRVSLMSEYTKITQEVQRELAEEVGYTGWEISAHAFCAVDHESVQGCIFENAEYEKLQNHEPATDIDGETHHLEKRAVGEYNCRHLAFPYMIGISEPRYSEKYLDRIQAENEVGVQYHGERKTLYEATQIQRGLETELRRNRGALAIIKGVAGHDPAFAHDKAVVNKRIKELRGEYDRLGKLLQPHSVRQKNERSYNVRSDW
jgi:hypothetical protein